ncbi:acetyl-CoA carboxylase biotin carboxyl carrier protein [Sneathiella sp. HT1-7]|jgi:acetyl-CoA carboxylase biotin carboxyl carrier protein|uniref:acetyl-CoA carboxylase biotin carboxyl carrier protein n=1 Tax=Sneathiella sp. HT1-7 TaxID=2887192 RepID=UPI001D14EF5F|nr:acetyl-CoA carboxylase biotin carboxyl carrier protein [Sneathiella sp. HT1-7]MCC3305965.1 acetyl-CoA carboxylase biotin carboxyl carrier protein [Sneathiella sp. HT1-7]
MNKLNIDKKAIRDLAEIMNETGLGEIEIENGDHRLRVSRGSTSAGVDAAQAFVPAAMAAPVAVAPAAVASDAESHPGAVKSPMVGTVYLSPEPTAAPFVRPGDMVTEGQTLLIVEAMKTMNPIASPKAGKVVEILVANEEPCEFGQPLVILE